MNAAAPMPRRVGPYRLLELLGAGGMGVVYLGVNAAGEFAAVKIVHPGLAHDEQFRARFAREITIGKQVGGPWIASVLDADPTAPNPWLASQYVHGPSLEDVVRTSGPVPIDVVHVVAAGVAAALVALHTVGLIHRDVKPSNILLATDGPRLIDFGISCAVDATRLTSSGMIIGSPGFMSPEQVEGEDLGPETDVFSLGATLVHAATGVGPFGEGTPIALLRRVGTVEPDLGGLAEPVRGIVAACLRKDQQARPTAADLTGLLHPAPDVQPGAWLPPAVTRKIAPPPVAPTRIEYVPRAQASEASTPLAGRSRLRGPLRRRTVLAGAGLLAVAAGVGGTALWRGLTSRSLWTTSITSTSATQGLSDEPVPRSIIGIAQADGVVYVVSGTADRSANDIVHALDPATGSVKWEFDVLPSTSRVSTIADVAVGAAASSAFRLADGPGAPRWTRAGQLLGVADQLAITVGRGDIGAMPGFFAYDLHSGALQWTHPAPGNSVGDYRAAAAAATPGFLHIGRAKQVDTIDTTTGVLRWSQPWDTTTARDSLTAVGDTLYVRHPNAAGVLQLLAADGATGAVRWEQGMPASRFAPEGDNLYTATDNVVNALDPAGRQRWICYLPEMRPALFQSAALLTPIPGGGVLLTTSEEQGDGSTNAVIAVAGGEQLWRHDLGTSVAFDPIAPAVFGKTAVFGFGADACAISLA